MTQIAMHITEDQGKRLPIYYQDTNRQKTQKASVKLQMNLAYRVQHCNTWLTRKDRMVVVPRRDAKGGFMGFMDFIKGVNEVMESVNKNVIEPMTEDLKRAQRGEPSVLKTTFDVGFWISEKVTDAYKKVTGK